VDSDEVARDYQGLAASHQAAGEFEKAAEYYKKALYLRERQLGTNGSDVAMLTVNLGRIYADWGRYSSATELLQQAIGKLECAHDDRLPSALESLGTVYGKCGRYEDAAVCFMRARAIWEQKPGTYEAELKANAVLISGIIPHLKPDHALRALPPMAVADAPAFSSVYTPQQQAELPQDSGVPVLVEANQNTSASVFEETSAATPVSLTSGVRQYSAATPLSNPPVQISVPGTGQPAGTPAGSIEDMPPASLIPLSGGVRQFSAVKPLSNLPVQRTVLGTGQPAAAPVGPTHLAIKMPAGSTQPDPVPILRPVPTASPEALSGLQGWDELAFDLVPLG
jgi:hypothetical protein